MNYLYDFLINNFIVLCTVVILGITLVRKINTHKRTSIYLLVILFITLLICVLDTLQNYCEKEMISVIGTSICGSILYVLRPLCILCFIFLSSRDIKGVWFYLLLAPLAINIIIVLFPYFEATRTLSYYYDYSSIEGRVEWHPGEINLFRFMPHIVSIIYLVVLVIKSVELLQRRHFADAVGVFSCAGVVSLAAVVETFFNESGDIVLLPSSIAICTVFYYLFLYERRNKIDVLTGLFNRASYFDDFEKSKKDITGVVQLDMNGLKYLNDNYGHVEGDNGLKRIASAISNNITRKMYAYRVGGDEFVVIAINESEEQVLNFISKFKEELKTTKYYCSIGYACRSEENDDIDKMLKLSEERMYLDKAEFYKSSEIERRKTSYITKE